MVGGEELGDELGIVYSAGKSRFIGSGWLAALAAAAAAVDARKSEKKKPDSSRRLDQVCNGP